jgi:hypothetical protein
MHYQMKDGLDILYLIIREFEKLDFKERDASVPRQLHKLSRHAEILADFALMNLDEETARRIRNRALTERRTYYEQSLSRT